MSGGVDVYTMHGMQKCTEYVQAITSNPVIRAERQYIQHTGAKHIVSAAL